MRAWHMEKIPADSNNANLIKTHFQQQPKFSLSPSMNFIPCRLTAWDRATVPPHTTFPSEAPDASSCRKAAPQEQGTHQSVFMVQMKNWEPLVLGPAFAMDRMPAKISRGEVCCPRRQLSGQVTHKRGQLTPLQRCLSLKILELEGERQGPEDDQLPRACPARLPQGGLAEAPIAALEQDCAHCPLGPQCDTMLGFA